MPENKSSFWYLKQIDLFQGMNEEEIMKLAPNVYERSCKRKEILYTPFQSDNAIYIIKKGEVTLYHSKSGKKLILDVLKPGSVFGNIGFDYKNATHFAEVTAEAYICCFSMEDFLNIIQHNPNLMMRFMKVISDKLAEYEHRLKGSLLDAKERIIHYLELFEEKNKENLLMKVARYKHKITHTELAEYTSLSRETVTRAITELKKEGKIVEDAHHKIRSNM